MSRRLFAQLIQNVHINQKHSYKIKRQGTSTFLRLSALSTSSAVKIVLLEWRMHLIASCTRNSPGFKSPNKNPQKRRSKNMEFAKFRNLQKNKQSPGNSLALNRNFNFNTQSSTWKKSKKTSSFERVHLHYFADPVLNIGGESKSNLRGQIGDAHALRSDLNRLVGHDTHLLPNQKRSRLSSFQRSSHIWLNQNQQQYTP